MLTHYHELLTLLMKFISSLPDPLLMRYKPLPRCYFPILLFIHDIKIVIQSGNIEKQLFARVSSKRYSRKFCKIPRRQLCLGPFLNKVAGLQLAILLKRNLCHRCFRVNVLNFLRTPFLQMNSGQLYLNVYSPKNISVWSTKHY